MTEPVEVKPRFATPPVSEPQARPHTRPEFQSKGGFMNFVSQNKFMILVIVLMIIIILVLLYFFVWSKRSGEEKIDRGGGNESYDGRNAGGYQQLQTRLSQPMPGQPGGQSGQPTHQPGQPSRSSQSNQDGRPESQSSPEKRPSLTREELIEKLARANKNLTKTEQTAQESSEVEQEYELREQDDRDDEYITD